MKIKIITPVNFLVRLANENDWYNKFTDLKDLTSEEIESKIDWHDEQVVAIVLFSQKKGSTTLGVRHILKGDLMDSYLELTENDVTMQDNFLRFIGIGHMKSSLRSNFLNNL